MRGVEDCSGAAVLSSMKSQEVHFFCYSGLFYTCYNVTPILASTLKRGPVILTANLLFFGLPQQHKNGFYFYRPPGPEAGGAWPWSYSRSGVRWAGV